MSVQVRFHISVHLHNPLQELFYAITLKYISNKLLLSVYLVVLLVSVLSLCYIAYKYVRSKYSYNEQRELYKAVLVSVLCTF